MFKGEFDFFRTEGIRRDITPQGFPVGLRIIEEQSVGALRDGVDFRTKRVIDDMPLRDADNEEIFVECEVHLDDGAIFDGRYKYKPTGYYLTLEDLQLAREAVGYAQLNQQKLDKLRRIREERGFEKVEFRYPRIAIPTSQLGEAPKRKRLLARIMDVLTW